MYGPKNYNVSPQNRKLKVVEKYDLKFCLRIRCTEDEFANLCPSTFNILIVTANSINHKDKLRNADTSKGCLKICLFWLSCQREQNINSLNIYQ